MFVLLSVCHKFTLSLGNFVAAFLIYWLLDPVECAFANEKVSTCSFTAIVFLWFAEVCNSSILSGLIVYFYCCVYFVNPLAPSSFSSAYF